MDNPFDIVLGLACMILTVICLHIWRYGFLGALFGAHIVRKLGYLSGRHDADSAFQLEILELKNQDGETMVGLYVGGSYKFSEGVGGGHRWAAYTLTKEEALEFARILRKSATGANAAG